MKKQALSVSLILCGLCLLVIYWFWAPDGRSNWTLEQAKEHETAGKTYHDLSYKQHRTAAQAKENAENLKQAADRWKKSKDELDGVLQAAERKARILFWAGIIATVIGIITFRPVSDDG